MSFMWIEDLRLFETRFWHLKSTISNLTCDCLAFVQYKRWIKGEEERQGAAPFTPLI